MELFQKHKTPWKACVDDTFNMNITPVKSNTFLFPKTYFEMHIITLYYIRESVNIYLKSLFLFTMRIKIPLSIFMENYLKKIVENDILKRLHHPY